MDRRSFIKSLTLVSGGLLVNNDTIFEFEEILSQKGFPILQGFTDATTTQFTIDLPHNLITHYEVIDLASGKRFEPSGLTTARREFSRFRVDKIFFNQLYLNDGFALIVRDSRNNIIDQREFKTLDTEKQSAKIAFLSCMLDLNPAHKEMWRLVGDTNPDMLFLLGDNVYGDFYGFIRGPRLLWIRYLQTRKTLALYRRKNLIPTIAIWDDHDYGANNATGDYKFREESLATFRDFYAQTPQSSAYKLGPGISSSFRAFGQKFIFLDDRYWRALRGPRGTSYLGEEQLDWVTQELNHDAQQSWLIQGSQFFGEHKNDGANYQIIAPEELDELGRRIRATDKQAHFVSGDVHFTEVSEVPRSILGYDSYEFTSSCLHSLTKKAFPTNNRRLTGALKENFLLLNIFSSEEFNVDCFGKGQVHHFNFDPESA